MTDGVLSPTLADATELSLVVEPATLVVRPGKRVFVTARLINRGSRSLTLVLPGDGSRTGRRTPVIEWTFVPGGTLPGIEGCGNINPLKAGEVFTLTPGATQDLGSWVDPSVLPAVRKSHAVMTYWNQPALPFRGVPLGAHSEAELALLRSSEPCRISSNKIEVLIEGDLRRRSLPPFLSQV